MLTTALLVLLKSQSLPMHRDDQRRRWHAVDAQLAKETEMILLVELAQCVLNLLIRSCPQLFNVI
jgi:hypothetical protein